jgi:sugar lactone lactonase YvrE
VQQQIPVTQFLKLPANLRLDVPVARMQLLKLPLEDIGVSFGEPGLAKTSNGIENVQCAAALYGLDLISFAARVESKFVRVNRKWSDLLQVKAAFSLRQSAAAVCGLFFLINLPAGADDLYVADFVNNTVEQIDPSGHSSVYVSSGLSGPMGVAFDNSGNLYIGNWYSGTIVKVASNGQSTLFATGLNYPRGMACDSAGNLYVANYYGDSIVKFNSAGQESIFAGGLNQPTGLAIGPDGNIYVADRNNNITKFNSNGQGSLFVSTGSGPEGLAFDQSGNLYVACYFSEAVYKYNPGGIGGFFASTGSGYNNPFGLAFDSAGNLYVSCNVNVMEKIGPGGNVSDFANTLPGPWYIAVKPVPEPSMTGLIILGGMALLSGFEFWKRAA